MSIGGIGSANGLSQSLAMLLSQLTGTQASGSVTDDAADEFGGCAAAPAAPQAAGANNSLTGSTKASLSDQILALLTQLQQQAGTSGANASTAISTISASTAIGTSDPLQQLISAMDSDGDGTVSQSEMESYIEKQGGTAAQGDALFAGLNQGGTGNLTQSTLASDLQQAQSTGAMHGHHHHHHHAAPSADQVGNDLVSAMDSDGSGAVDQSEFENFVTGLGGTTAQADSDFAALDPQDTGSVDAAQFSSAVTALQTASASGPQSPILTLLDAFKQTANSSTGSTVSMTA
jgi:Ca2+-binding EF-hand superfamily protein